MGRKSLVRKRVEEIAREKALPVERVEAVIHDLAALKEAPPGARYSLSQIASRYGMQLGELLSLQHMARVPIEKIRQGMITKHLVISNAATDALMDKLNDSDELAKIRPMELAKISKLSHDTVRDLSGRGISQQEETDLAALRMIRDAHEARLNRPSLAQLIEAKNE